MGQTAVPNRRNGKKFAGEEGFERKEQLVNTAKKEGKRNPMESMEKGLTPSCMRRNEALFIVYQRNKRALPLLCSAISIAPVAGRMALLIAQT